jgi:type IV pilus assembly protein PilB
MLGADFVDLIGREVILEILEKIPREVAETYKMVAFDIDQDLRLLKVAMLDPKDIKAREALRYIGRNLNLTVQYYLASKEGLESVLRQYGNIKKEVGEALESAKERFEQKEEQAARTKGVQSLQEMVKHAPVAKIVSVILRHAVEGRASDIHIEPMENVTRARYRIDGDLVTSITLPLYIHDALVARIKVVANLKIDETRIPQDGRIRMEMQDRTVEFRVSTLPLQGHEKVVMRVLEASGSHAPSLEDLGYRARNFEVIKRNLSKPNGMLLVTGPTGSGKSKTLFAALNIVNSEDVNISTLEDPVEYRLAGVNHSQIQPNVGFTFASGLRALLRQDPNIIMVGEIRDFETAELAIHAAMTGHLVFSTLHTNSAVGAIPRLLDMKIEPFLLSTTLNVVMAQRLIKTICNDCKAVAEIDDSLEKEVLKELESVPINVLKQYGDISLENSTFYHGTGCSRCSNTGSKGRTSINEAVENTKSMRRVINSGMKQEEVAEVLREQNFISMKQDGLIKVLLGITTVEEVLAVTREDEV